MLKVQTTGIVGRPTKSMHAVVILVTHVAKPTVVKALLQLPYRPSQN